MSTKHISTDNLSTATAQEVFDFIVAHLREQGGRAESKNEVGNSSCKYRLENLQCAAGCLIPDEKYSPNFEGQKWYGVSRSLGVSSYHFDLISDMQSIHDSVDPAYWEDRFESAARIYKLVLAAK